MRSAGCVAAPRRRTAGTSFVALGVLVIAGTALRLWGLGAHRLDFDEAFTAMAGRRPFTTMLTYLRVRDSHPPLDYLLREPLARADVSEWAFRLPSTACSIGALGLFAWWMRDRGLAGVLATGLLAVSAFQVVHGREARMYAELELLGVAAAVTADSWLRRPRPWNAPVIGALVLLGLLTHVSMLLGGGGLVLLAGRRTDRDAWSWRAGLASAGLAWALLWGDPFLEQARGGHSSWIPSTTPSGLVHTLGDLVTPESGVHGLLLVAVAAGVLLLWRADRMLGRVLVCCVLVPETLVALIGLHEPALLDRTLTSASWGPCLALGALVAAAARHSRAIAAVAVGALALVVIPPAVDAVAAPSSLDRAVRHVEQVARSGDVVASHPGGRLHLLLWSVAVRHRLPFRMLPLAGPGNSTGAVVGRGTASRRTWLLVSTRLPFATSRLRRCAPDWTVGRLRVLCLLDEAATAHFREAHPSTPTAAVRF